MAENVDIIVRLKDAASKGIRAIKGSMGELEKSVGSTRKILGSMVGTLGTLAATIGAGAFLGSAIKTFADFDTAIRSAGAVSNATAEELKDLSDAAKEMGKTTKFSAVQAADGLKLLGMAGFETKESIEALPGVLNLAAAAGTDIATSADIATNVLSGFGLEVENLGQVNDVLVKTFTSSNTAVQELGESFKYVGPLFKAVGGNFEELFATIGKLGDVGIKGSQAGTALKGALQQLLNATPEQIKLQKELGERIGQTSLEVLDAQGSFVGYTRIVEQLSKAGVNGSQILKLFGTEAGPAMAALVGQGSESIKELQTAIEEAGGISEEVAKKMGAGLGGAILEAKSAFEAVKIAIGEAFSEDLIQGIRVARDWLIDLVDVIKELKENGTIEAWATVTKIGFGTVTTSAKIAWAAVKEVVKVFTALGLLATGQVSAAGEALKDLGSDFVAVAESMRQEVEKSEGTRFFKIDTSTGEITEEVNAVGELIKKAVKTGPIGQGVKEASKELSEALVPKAAPVEALLKAEMTKLSALLSLESTKIEDSYERGLIDLETYYNERAKIIQRKMEQEIQLLSQKASSETDLGKKELLNAQIFAKEQELQAALLSLETERYREQDRLAQERLSKDQALNQLKLKAEQALADQKKRLANDPAYGLQGQFSEELANLQTKHNAELEEINNFYVRKLDMLRQQKAAEAEIEAIADEQKKMIDDQKRMQREEEFRLEQDQQSRLVNFQLNNYANLAGGMADTLSNAYELIGKENKEMFYAMKAAAIAEAVIKTAQAVVSAYATAGNPYLGIAMAAIVGAAGAVQVAKIASQSYAEGGLIAGQSPTKTSDDKLINATSGEFMQPVDTVDYYGLGVMEALRRRAIPKDMFTGFNMPSIKYGHRQFAEGGAVTPASGIPDPNDVKKEGQKTNIVNVLDPAVFEQWSASTPGQKNIMNVISQNAFEVRQMILGN